MDCCLLIMFVFCVQLLAAGTVAILIRPTRLACVVSDEYTHTHTYTHTCPHTHTHTHTHTIYWWHFNLAVSHIITNVDDRVCVCVCVIFTLTVVNQLQQL